MTRNVSRRLIRLETRAQEVAAATPEPHTIVFVDVDMSVTSVIHFDHSKRVWREFADAECSRAQPRPE